MDSSGSCLISFTNSRESRNETAAESPVDGGGAVAATSCWSRRSRQKSSGWVALKAGWSPSIPSGRLAPEYGGPSRGALRKSLDVVEAERVERWRREVGDG